MTKEQAKLKTRLTLIFWINVLLFIAAGIILVAHVGIEGKSASEQDFVMERFGIIIAIIVIPLSLKWFHTSHKKIAKEAFPVFLKKTERLFLIRLLAIDFVILFNFAGFYCIGALNFIYMAGIAVLALSMCYPVEAVIDPEVEDSRDNKEENLN